MRKLMWFTVGFCLSCIAGIFLLSGSLLGWVGLIAGVFAAILLFCRPKVCKIIATVLIGVTVGVIWLICYNGFYLDPARKYDGKQISATITVTDYSYKTAYGSGVDGTVTLGEKQYRVRVYFQDMPELKPGDSVTGQFHLALTIPEGSESSDYYQGKGIFLLANAEESVTVTHCEQIPGKYFPVKLRRSVTNLLDRIFPQDVLGFVRALLLGDSSLLTYQEDTDFKISGIRHVIAVSGLHVSILFGLIYALVGRHRVWTTVVGIPVLVLFAAVAGFSPSVVRACVMQSLMMLALLLKKDYDPPTALAFAVLVILASNPMTITSLSFQLSVGCVIGMFLFSGRIGRYLMRKMGVAKGKSPKAKFLRRIASGIAVTLSAMTLTTPLVALNFGMVSLVSVITNLLTVWVISFIFYGIIFACICGAIWLPFGQWMAGMVAWPARYVLGVAKVCAGFPLSAVYTYSAYIVAWIAVCYLLFGIFLISKKKRPLLLCISMLICLFASVAVTHMETGKDNFRVTVFDVGEGQSILLQTGGRSYLVDCGGNSGERVADMVSETLLSQGIRKLDGIILTHYDADHTNGLIPLLSRIQTRRIYLPNIEDDGDTKELLRSSYGNQIDWIERTSGFYELTMIPADSDATGENESGLCVLFQPENYDILITGDRDTAGERALLERFDVPELELLIAGHHGAQNATSLELLSATRPDIVAISTSGRYGHPAPGVIRRIGLFQCLMWTTKSRGTLIFRG